MGDERHFCSFIHSWTGVASRGERGGEEDVRNQLCIRVSTAQTEAGLSNLLFYTDTCPCKDKSRKIMYVIFTTSLTISCFHKGFHVLELIGKNKSSDPMRFYQCPQHSGNIRHLQKIKCYWLLHSKLLRTQGQIMPSHTLKICNGLRGGRLGA